MLPGIIPAERARCRKTLCGGTSCLPNCILILDSPTPNKGDSKMRSTAAGQSTSRPVCSKPRSEYFETAVSNNPLHRYASNYQQRCENRYKAALEHPAEYYGYSKESRKERSALYGESDNEQTSHCNRPCTDFKYTPPAFKADNSKINGEESQTIQPVPQDASIPPVRRYQRAPCPSRRRQPR